MSQSFRARLEQRLARVSQGASKDLWRYREAASVLVFFDYESLQPFGEVSPSSNAKTELLADCDVEYLSGGTPRWSLRTPIRQIALHRLLEKQNVKAALAANPTPDTYAQKLLERLLKNHQDPALVVRARAAFGSPEENQDLLQVIGWLSGVPEFDGKLPRVEEVKQRIALENLVEPFRQLVGAHFAGRTRELEDLANYVGVHDAYSAAESGYRVVERILSLKNRPPLFIHGPGGSGKSTLIAKFILQHATVEQSSRFPYAYLDFDRAGLLAEEPITLLFDIMRQLAIQFPAVNERYLTLADEWSSRLSQQVSESGKQDSSAPIDLKSLQLPNRELFISEFAEFVKSLQAKDQPLLLVLDTFEEIQFRSTAYTDLILNFLEELQKQVPRLRTVLSGRDDIQPKNYSVQPVPIENFDTDAAVSYLAGRGLTDSRVAQVIFEQVGGSPLVLRLAADVAKIEKVDEKGIDLGWLTYFHKKSIPAVLYKRILSHVYNERVEKLAYPGLVLRVITPNVLQEVLGPACEVSIASLDDAKGLVKLMKARLSTILVPATGEYEVLIHRPDMRSILLSDLKTTAEKSPETAKKLTNIHNRAIDYYSKSPDPAHRAEEIYHRLALGIDRKVLKERWMEGLTPFLGSSIRELPRASQVYLAARLKLELPDELWGSAEDEDWILYASRLVDQMLALQKPFDALKVLKQRTRLWFYDDVIPIFTKVTTAVFNDYARRYEELRDTHPAGGKRTGLMNGLVAQIRTTASDLPLDAFYAQQFFREGGPGKRLVALAIAYAGPRPEHMDLAIAAIQNALSPFEQYHALRLATALFDQATTAQRRALLYALRNQEGTPIHDSDPSRFVLKNDLLGRFSKISIFSIEVIRARRGDCLILHYGSADNPHLVLIDGGPKGVYAPYLKPRLEQIRAARNLSTLESLPVDLLMISHPDNDHMQGILDLTRELLSAQMSNQLEFVQVFNLWHNSFETIIGSDTSELTNAFKNQFGSASLGGDPPDLTIDSETSGLSEKEVFANLQVLAGINQNAQLRNDAQHLGLQLNAEFDGALVVARPKSQAIDIGSGLKFRVIGPMPGELKKLQKKHQTWLKERATSGLTPEDALSAYIDKSVPSLSSIVVMAEVGKKRVLLTGDARGDSILEGLELAGLVKREGKIHVDVLKVPQHGNARNLPYDFFDRVTADHYIFSGNGEHGSPDRESFEMLMDARKADEYTIHLTYPIAEIDATRKLDWEKEQSKERKKQEKARRRVRPDWSSTSHSLQALLDKNPQFAEKIRILEDNQPHVINLLSEV